MSHILSFIHLFVWMSMRHWKAALNHWSCHTNYSDYFCSIYFDKRHDFIIDRVIKKQQWCHRKFIAQMHSNMQTAMEKRFGNKYANKSNQQFVPFSVLFDDEMIWYAKCTAVCEQWPFIAFGDILVDTLQNAMPCFAMIRQTSFAVIFYHLFHSSDLYKVIHFRISIWIWISSLGFCSSLV